MKINRKVFFAAVRQSMGPLSQGQIVGLEAIVDALEHYKITDSRHMAFCLSTAEGEVGTAFAPVRETFATTDAQARQRVAKLIRDKGLPNYGKPSPRTGFVYYGRGFVQLTWEDNYAKLSTEVGVDLVKNPDAALEPGIAARILVIGSAKGLFVPGHKMSRYFSVSNADWEGARRIINGTNKKKVFADLGRKWHGILLSPGVLEKEVVVTQKPAAPVTPLPQPPVAQQPAPTPQPSVVVVSAEGKADNPAAAPKDTRRSAAATIITAFIAALAALATAIFYGGSTGGN